MEYIKKEELIIGEIYKSNKYNHIFKYQSINGNTNINIGCNYRHFSRGNATIGQGLNNITNATSEEKHWLNCCITADKFITFEEAMKTFIPEYVECIQTSTDRFTKNKIYKVEDKGYVKAFVLLDDGNVNTILPMIGSLWSFKPSTKEAYDAQFVVKEPEFVLPEKWCVKTTLSSKNILQDYLQNNIINYPEYLKTWEVISDRYFHNKGHGYEGGHSSYKIFDGFIEITFEQFKKYVLKDETVEKKVIEPLPQFKVIESIETITKVENNEGNQFFIGDVVISDSGFVQTIKSFRYNVNKDNVLATTNVCNQISIARLEHYIEPKVEDQFKIGDTIKISTIPVDGSQPKYLNNNYKIIKIRGKQLLFETNSIPPINSVLAKNAIKVN